MIDVVVPAFNEERHVARCLDSIFAQDYPAEGVRVWVVDAGSTDRTAALVEARAAGEPRLTLVSGDGRLNAAQACNLGIEQGSAELVARVDAHTYLEPDYLAQAAAILDALPADVACVGGQPLQQGETRFGRGVALARASRFGVGGSVYAERRESVFVDTVQAGVYRREALEAAGGFATNMLVGEDEELNWRLRKDGYRVLLDARLRFSYTTRGSWRQLFRQYRNYGRSRARVLAAHPDFLRVRHLAPPGLVVALAALAAASPSGRWARGALAGAVGGYAAGALSAATRATAGDEEPELTAAVAAAFPALHLGYGVGMLEGGLAWARARAGLGEPPVAVERR